MGKQKKNRQGAEKTFKKKKVKIGKKLPKAANFTKTSFKTKTINIIQQLNKDEQQATTKRKLNIKDLLSQCMHYNITVRLGAAQGLKELLSVSQDAVLDYLGLVIDRAGSLMTDKDYTIREAVLKLFEDLFETVPSVRMAPFFPMLCAHLCCAMTHINTEIQQDSLLLFDLLLKAYPQLIVNSSNQLLSNFVEQISKQKFKNMKLGSFMQDSGSKLTLSFAPNRQGSSQKWQSKVLSRLLKLLTIVLKEETEQMESSGNVLNFSEGQKSFTPFQSSMKQNWHHPGFIVKAKGIVHTNQVDLTDIQSIRQLVLNLFPLLIQCWVESHDSEKNDGSLLYPEATSIRTTVLQIVLLLIEYGAKNSEGLDVTWSKWLSENFESIFVTYFMTSFPFDLLKGKKNKKQKVPIANVSSENLNLAICNVMTKFIKTPADFQQQVWIQAILKYIRHNIKSADLQLDIRRQLLHVLSSLIYAVKPHDQLIILEDCVHRYQKAHPLSQEKQMFVDFFAKVISHAEDKSDLDRPLITFLDTLPDLLLEVCQSNEAISAKILTVIKDSVTSNITQVVKKWQSYIDHVYSIETGIFLTNPHNLRKSLTEIIYWMPEISSDKLRLFASLIQHEGLELSEGKYLIQVLQERFKKKVQFKLDIDAIADQLGFLILLMLGPQNGGLNSDINKAVGEWSVIEQHYWKKQTSLNSYICQVLCADFSDCKSLVNDAVWSSMEKKQNASLHLVLCLLSVLQQCPKQKDISLQLTEILIKFACNLFSSQSIEDNHTSFLFKLLEDAFCQPYIKTFLDVTTKNIFKSENEEAVCLLVKMLSDISNLQNIRTYIIESSMEDKHKLHELFEKVLKFVQERFPNPENEKWLSNLDYLMLQLK